MDYVDEVKTCRDCKQSFVFSVVDQRFFAEKGFQPPVRCKACRNLRKNGQAQQTAEGQSALTVAGPEIYHAPKRREAPRYDEVEQAHKQRKRVHKTRRRYQEENDDGYDY